MKKRLLEGLCYLMVGGFILAFAGLGLAALIGTLVVLWGSLSLGAGSVLATAFGLAEALSYVVFAALMVGSICSFILMAAKLRRNTYTTFNYYYR